MITKELLSRYRVLFIMLIIMGIAIIVHIAVWGAQPRTAADFGFSDEVSPCDADGDGVDDFADMVAGARAYIATNPVYESKYFAGGYPTDGTGVCTDVIWQAFAAAGYTLKDMVDADIGANHSAYFPDGKASDSNINFRRVKTLAVFFERHARSLPISTDEPSDWMPGDVVVYEKHIAICSDRRNALGLPYIIHHGSLEDGAVEVDRLTAAKIVGHYRFYGKSAA